MYPDPIAKLEQEDEFHKMLPKMPPQPEGTDEETRKIIEETPRRMFRDKVGDIYAGLLAAGREAEADKFAARARELDAEPGMTRTLIETALEADQPRPQQVEWLEKAARNDPESALLLERLRAALQKKRG